MQELEIILNSDLCAGNGESAGNSVDSDVCIDDAGIPYIPSMRLKNMLEIIDIFWHIVPIDFMPGELNWNSLTN